MTNKVTSRRIGIMGGTFDPIHYGHLMIAEQIRNTLYLDEIIFIPAGEPYHKKSTLRASKKQRLKMTKLATKTNPYFSVSDIEVKRDKPTYTIDTILELKRGIYAHDTLYFITGADALLYLDQWKHFDALIEQVHFIAASRPGIDSHELMSKVATLREMGASIEVAHISELAISSTDIRERMEREMSIRYLLPDSVASYIEKRGIYQTHRPEYEKMKKRLKAQLNPKLYAHCVATSKMARRLAYIHGADFTAAELAGLCHDYVKEMDNVRALHHIERFEIHLDPSIMNHPNTAHGEIAACLLKEELLIKDEAVLDAIRWHTYGHEEMSLLSKIVFLADVVEPNRSFNGVEDIRHLAYEDIDKAVLEYLHQSEVYLAKQSKPMHGNTKKLKSVLLRKGEK